MEKYEGTHKIKITNFGEDVDEITMNLNFDEFSLLKSIENKFRESHRPYAPQFIITDLDERKSVNDELKDKFNKHVKKHHTKPFKNNQLKEAFKKIGYH